MFVYHYTSFEAAEGILTNEGLNFKAFYYGKYNQDDYAWTQEIVTPIIEEICLGKGWYFDTKEPVDPFFISFCKNETSDNMWKSFGDDYCGVQLIFNSKLLEEFSLKEQNPDVYMDCIYTDKKGDIKSFLLGKGWDKYLIHSVNDEQGDLKEISVFILKPCFFLEQEYRYMIPHRKSVTFTQNGEFIEEEIDKEDCKCVLFPKEALVGINIGCESEIEIEDIMNLLEQRGYKNVKVNKGTKRYE